MKILPLYNTRALKSLRFLPLIMLVMMAGLTVNTLSAQDLSRNAQLQLKSLLEEKASRTKDQRKINSQIWYAYKKESDRRIAPEVPTLRTGVIKDAKGLIKTEIITDASGINITAVGMDFSPFALESAPGVVGERIYILKTAGAQTRALRIATNRGRLSIATQGATSGHNAAENTISVAATPANTEFPSIFDTGNSVETFSSDGPRRKFYHPDGSEITPGNLLFGTNGGIVLQKPDITAADNVATSVEGFNPFPGTSAAAPHAAAMAALVQEFLPTYSSTQVRDLLFNTAIDIETAGVDRDAGRGIMMPLKAIESLNLEETGCEE